MIGAGVFWTAALLAFLLWKDKENKKVALYEAQLAEAKAGRELRKYLQDHPDTLR